VHRSEHDPGAAFDYVIIGSGASGASSPTGSAPTRAIRVLVLEAGGPADQPGHRGPGGFVSLWGTEIDWSLGTEAQPGMAGREL
jgi:choline dehydrogenase